MKKEPVFSDNDRKKIARFLEKVRMETVYSSGLSLSGWVSRRTGIPKTSVAAYLASRTKEGNLRAKELTPKKKERIETLLLTGRPNSYVENGASISSWISRKTRIPERTIAAYIAYLSRTKNRVLIIESTFESIEDRSESNHLTELLRIYNDTGAIKTRPELVYSKDDFLTAITNSKEWYLHITSHGKHEEKTSIKSGIWSDVSHEDIKKCKPCKNNRTHVLVVVSACEAGHKDLAIAFKKIGYKYFVGPKEETYWYDAALFNTLFYRYLFIFRYSPKVAYNKTISKVPYLTSKEGGSWQIYINGKLAC